jgi:hypothetical protein
LVVAFPDACEDLDVVLANLGCWTWARSRIALQGIRIAELGGPPVAGCIDPYDQAIVTYLRVAEGGFEILYRLVPSVSVACDVQPTLSR